VSEPTNAAMEFVNKYFAGSPDSWKKKMAFSVDYETGLPELIAALKAAREKVAAATVLHMGEGMRPMYPKTLEQIDAALRKAGEL